MLVITYDCLFCKYDNNCPYQKDYIRTQSNLRDFIDTQKCNTPCDITMMCNAYEINTVTLHDEIMK